jgi:hypothetical protein
MGSEIKAPSFLSRFPLVDELSHHVRCCKVHSLGLVEYLVRWFCLGPV